MTPLSYNLETFTEYLGGAVSICRMSDVGFKMPGLPIWQNVNYSQNFRRPKPKIVYAI